jgi:hypothetical protein
VIWKLFENKLVIESECESDHILENANVSTIS